MGKTNFDISKTMRHDLLDAYNKVKGRAWNQAVAYELTVNSPAPRYYVTHKQAYQVIKDMVRGDFSFVDGLRPLRRKMYYSIYEKTLEMSMKRKYIGKSLWHIMRFVVLSPAPCFFISPLTLQKIFYHMNKGFVLESGERVYDKKRQYVLRLERAIEKRRNEERN